MFLPKGITAKVKKLPYAFTKCQQLAAGMDYH
jgi:hypothetical protein